MANLETLHLSRLLSKHNIIYIHINIYKYKYKPVQVSCYSCQSVDNMCRMVQNNQSVVRKKTDFL